MQFAQQTLSNFISGIFCIAWMGLLLHGIRPEYSDYIAGLFYIDGKINSGLLVFIGFPVTYSFGILAASAAKLPLALWDQKIRVHFFSTMDSEQIVRAETAIGNKPAETETSNLMVDWTNNTYHNFRYRLYLAKPEIYRYLNFHRENLRILRVMVFNLFLIGTVLVATYSRQLVPYVLGGLAIILIIFKAISSYRENKKWSALIFAGLTMLILIFLFHFFDLPMPRVICCSGAPDLKKIAIEFSFVAYALSFLSLLAWVRKQKNFYRTILHAERTLAAMQKHEETRIKLECENGLNP